MLWFRVPHSITMSRPTSTPATSHFQVSLLLWMVRALLCLEVVTHNYSLDMDLDQIMPLAMELFRSLAMNQRGSSARRSWKESIRSLIMAPRDLGLLQPIKPVWTIEHKCWDTGRIVKNLAPTVTINEHLCFSVPDRFWTPNLVYK